MPSATTPETNPAEVCEACGTPLAGVLGAQCPRCLLGLGTDFTVPGEDEAIDGLFHIRRFGDYELLEEIARGGMGVVYRARQISLDREVAVKMILAGELAGPESLKMFRREAHAAANLHHPSIVPVYEIGEHELQHYFTMRLVPGGRTIAHWAAAHRNDWPEIASAAAKVARAVAFAHSHGVLHRDLKPSNILWDDNAGPQVTDFGLAKLLGETDQKLTLSARVFGSPHYMAPEQAGGRDAEITTATDVYGLGAVLYELLGGKPPFSGSSAIETMRRAMDEIPAPLPPAPADLQTICFKALEKEPDRRYRSADALADDLERWLRNEPITARPATPAEQFGKWIRRKPLHASLMATATLSLIVLIVGQIFHTRRTNEARRQAETASRQLGDQLRRVEWQQAEEALAAGRTPDAMATFARFLRETPEDQMAASRLLSLLEQRAFPLPLLPPMKHDSSVNWGRMDGTGEHLFTIASDGVLRSWNLTTGACEKESRLDLSDDGLQSLPDGRRLLARTTAGRILVWDCQRWELVHKLGETQSGRDSWSLGADGRRVALLTPTAQLQLWDTVTGTLLAQTNSPSQSPELFPMLGPAGELLIRGFRRGLWIWRPDDRTLSAVLDPEEATLRIGCDWGRGRAYVVLAEFDTVTNAVASIDLKTGRELRREAVATRWDWSRASPDGRSLIVSRWGGGVVSVDSETLKENYPWFGQAPIPANLSTDRSFRTGFRALHDGTGRLYDLGTGLPLMEPVQHDGMIMSHDLSPDGTRLVTASQDGTARVWDLRMRVAAPVVASPGGWIFKLSPSHDHRSVAVAAGREVHAYDPRTGESRMLPVHADDYFGDVSFSPDDRFIAAGGSDRSAMLLETQTGRILWHQKELGGRVWNVVFSPDGRRLACSSEDGTAHVFEVATGRRLFPALRHQSAVTDVSFSPDNRMIATASVDSTAQLWNADDGRPIGPALRHQGTVWSARFSSDSRRLVTASYDRTAQIWDVKTGERTAPPVRADQALSGGRFSADGRKLLVYTLNSVRLFDTETSTPLTPPMRHGNTVSRIKVALFSPDGHSVATGSEDGTARIWDALSGFPITEAFPQYGVVSSIAWRPDSRQLLTGCEDGKIRRWSLPALAKSPGWLPDLAEALAGKKEDRTTGGVAVSMTRLDALRSQALTARADTEDQRWLRWFLVDRLQTAENPPVPLAGD